MRSGRASWADGLPDEIKVLTDWSYILDGNADRPSMHPPLLENKEIYLIDNLLSPVEADRIIEEAEKYGFGKTDYPKVISPT